MKGFLRFPRLLVSSRKCLQGFKFKSRNRIRSGQDVRLSSEKVREIEAAAQQLEEWIDEDEENSKGCEVEAEAGVAEVEVEEEARSVIYNGDVAQVTLHHGQVACMDGSAMVCCLHGRASMLGYILRQGIESFVCSSSKISPAVCFEPCRGSVIDDESEEGCILQFTSYGSENLSRPSFKIVVSEKVPGMNVDGPSELFEEMEKQATFCQDLEAGVEGKGAGNDNMVDVEDSVSTESADDGDVMEMDGPAASVRKRKLEESSPGNKRKKGSQEEIRSILLPDDWCTAAVIVRDGDVSTYGRGSVAAPVVVVCGAKNAGKSTFGRYLVNTLLNRFEAVGYLDTDLGQPEFTVPGCLSLHIIRKPVTGPPAFHLRNPERCFFFGDVSPKSNPELYMKQIVSLFQYFQEDFGGAKGEQLPRIPLVINTHGWLKGVGYELLVRLIGHACTTHVVQVRCQAKSKNLPPGRFWEEADNCASQTTLLNISSPAAEPVDGGNPVGRSAIHLRGLRILSYFQQCFGRSVTSSFPFKEDKLFMDTAMGLVRHKPYMVSASDVRVVHVHSKVASSESLCSINGTLVGLGVSSKSRDGQPLSVGFGIVRSVDLTLDLIYVITPLSLLEIQEVDILLQGRVKLPWPLLQAKGSLSPYLCLNSVAVEGTGSAVMKNHKGSTRRAG